ncbi:hypothetical protein A2714_02665 [Candidatus Woesebacteria bacterium RIFCSPHIGHO2_01_FULL_38_9]|uniref:Uncharacterized protein n=2 Tax=Candidatus Woeseibacteriota TaxID=1752722 RepID=A0A1F7Y363_9BACT|nr:MAG: hypothetical protein A2714_02665 [Candidatus Woesebacteria bacterium RIFCSPHIGHO2_01_FULL_38_9]OGM59693.1 MAG: hypothetical protein A3A75_00925 [Candidatus Woesebacteria bacterium RIFCSPLOWO2_01_FULL_39_10]
MSARKQEKINLLPQKGFEATTTGRLLAWVLSTFRIIVIVTEIIVMIAFLSRFWLDAQNADLNEEIEEKKAVLMASANQEKEFRDTQKRLSIFSNTVSLQGTAPNALQKIVSYLPDDLFLTQVTFDKSAFNIEGATPSEQSIQQFVVNLNASGSFSEVFLQSIQSETKDSNLLIFKISATLTKSEGK